MHYLGGKHKIGPQIAGYINSLPDLPYLEPFVGAGWVLQYIRKTDMLASDYHPDLILMWQALQQGWIPPNDIVEDEYNALKYAAPSALRSVAGFGCSYGGKWFGGYARGTNRNYALEAKCSLIDKICRMSPNVIFRWCDYADHAPNDCIIYCDPPYEGTTKFHQSFSHKRFWNIMRKWSQNNIVLISEYQAPDDFKMVADWYIKSDICSKERVEKLWRKND